MNRYLIHVGVEDAYVNCASCLANGVITKAASIILDTGLMMVEDGLCESHYMETVYGIDAPIGEFVDAFRLE